MTIYDRYIDALVRFRGQERSKSRLKQRFGGLMLKYAPGLIDCRTFDRFLADYIDGNLSDTQLRLFEAHMKLCPMCRAHFQTYLATHEMVGGVFGGSEEPVPDTVPDELVDAVFEVLHHGKKPQGD